MATVLLGVFVAIFGTLAATPAPDHRAILLPVLATVGMFIGFALLLGHRLRTHLLGEVGFLYLVFALAYTVIPALGFLALQFIFPPIVGGSDIVTLSPTPRELGIHFWRHFLFVSFVSCGYLIGRGRTTVRGAGNGTSAFGGTASAVFWTGLVVGCALGLAALSGPVETYYDHYTRFDHLPWIARRVVSLMLMLKTGGYLVLLTIAITRRRGRMILPLLLLGIAGYETVYSFGARIEVFLPVLTGLLLYHLHVRPIPMRAAAAVLFALGVAFSAMGLFRSAGYDPAEARQRLLVETGTQLSEFGALYSAGFHLYSERAGGRLPPRPAGMLVYEFIALVPFVDKEPTHPQYWYHRNYFPSEQIPGHTLGIIADSAIWGGELDLALRALLNGLVFGLVARWYFARPRGALALSLYAYLCATTIMTLKYSVFFQVVLVWRHWIPVFTLAWLLSLVLKRRHTGSLGSGPVESARVVGPAPA